jgi:type II secretory pathway pseudopilin PulG
MGCDLKAFARGMLTLLEIIIVAAFIASLAAIAALGSLGARKRNRAAEIPKALRLVDSAMDCDAA